jgi:translation elongation factor EF-1alpha
VVIGFLFLFKPYPRRILITLVVMCRYCEMGTVVIGKVESGKCQKGDLLLVMPNRVSLYFIAVFISYRP